jgi:hypothetical protein
MGIATPIVRLETTFHDTFVSSLLHIKVPILHSSLGPTNRVIVIHYPDNSSLICLVFNEGYVLPPIITGQHHEALEALSSLVALADPFPFPEPSLN